LGAKDPQGAGAAEAKDRDKEILKAPPAEKPRTTESAVEAARQRFLARKQQGRG
jgi:hypothetical protein